LCTPERCELLDGLLRVDPDLGMARASWLRRFAVAACPKDLLEEMDKLVFLRELGAGDWDLGALPLQRVTTLARWVQAASNQALAQSSPERRYPALLAFAAQRVVEVTDELVDLFDRLLGEANAKARKRLGEYQQSIAAAANDKVLLLAEIARVLLDPDVDDADRSARLFAVVPQGRLAAALADCERIARPADNSHIDLLGDPYSRLRQCVPRLLEVLTFRAHRDARELLAGIEVLRELNRTGRRKVPRDAPLTFVPKVWMPFVVSGPDTVSRRFWELALLWRLRDGLRSGEVWVAGSRRYADPETYLLDRVSWTGMRNDYCAAVRRPRSGAERITQLSRELDQELASFAGMLARGEGPVRLDGDRLVVGRDTGDDLPASVKQFKNLVAQVFPQVELAEVVIASTRPAGFPDTSCTLAGPVTAPQRCSSTSTPPSWPRPPTLGRWRWPAPRACPMTRSPTPPPGTCGRRRSPRPSTRSSTTIIGCRRLGRGVMGRSPPPTGNASPSRSRPPTRGRCPVTSGSAVACRCSPR
jgi:hypothetical protein